MNIRGKKSEVWRCVSRLEEKGGDCSSQTILEEVLQAGITKAINQMIDGRKNILSVMAENIEKVLEFDNTREVEDFDERLVTLQEEIIRLASSKSDYQELANEIHRIRSMKQVTMVEQGKRHTQMQRIDKMRTFLKNQSGNIDEYDDKLTRQLVEEITVHDEKIQVIFKSGLELDVSL